VVLRSQAASQGGGRARSEALKLSSASSAPTTNRSKRDRNGSWVPSSADAERRTMILALGWMRTERFRLPMARNTTGSSSMVCGFLLVV